jgi:hypothetical protein
VHGTNLFRRYDESELFALLSMGNGRVACLGKMVVVKSGVGGGR